MWCGFSSESEDHSTRAVYEIHLGAEASAGAPADSSRDYAGTKYHCHRSQRKCGNDTGSDGPAQLRR